MEGGNRGMETRERKGGGCQGQDALYSKGLEIKGGHEAVS